MDCLLLHGLNLQGVQFLIEDLGKDIQIGFLPNKTILCDLFRIICKKHAKYDKNS